MAVREHGDQQTHRPMRCRPQNGPQLHEENIGFGEAVSDRPLPECRIGRYRRFRAFMRRIERLVGTDIDRADGDRPPLHTQHCFTVSLVLLILTWHLAAVHEEELGTKQAHPGGTSIERLSGFGRQFDIGQQLDRHLIQRGRGHMHEALELLALKLLERDAVAIFLQHGIIGRHDHHARLTIEDEPVVVAHDLRRLAQSDHGRHVHAARQNGRVRCRAAQVDGKSAGSLQLEHVGRRNVMGHEDEWIVTVSRAFGQGAHRSG